MTTFLPDALGRIREQTTGTSLSQSTTAFEWLAHGNVTSLTPPGQAMHVQSYTPVDLLAAYTPPGAGSGNVTTTYSYTPDRRPKTEHRPDGMLLTRSYDSTSGKLVGIAQPGFGNLGYEFYPLSGLPAGGVPGKLKKITGPAGGW